MITRFEDLEVWKKSRELCRYIFELTLRPEFSKDFGLVNQIRNSSGSVMDNIAEGFERGSNKEFIQFLFISKGSAGEVRSQLHRASDRKYITEDEFHNGYTLSVDTSRIIKGFIDYLRKSEFKGPKFS